MPEEKAKLLPRYLEGGAGRRELASFMTRREMDSLRYLLVVKRDLEKSEWSDPTWNMFSASEAQQQQTVFRLWHLDERPLTVESVDTEIEKLLHGAVRRKAGEERATKTDLLSMP